MNHANTGLIQATCTSSTRNATFGECSEIEGKSKNHNNWDVQ